jgi:selenocysteine lyase/cysteine desulfurase
MSERRSLPAEFQKFAELRRQFPALQQTRAGQAPIFLDGPGGTQVPQTVLDAMIAYLKNSNANHGQLGNRFWPEHDDADTSFHPRDQPDPAAGR